ncbi:hypothetical protein PYW08_003472 [Mythimna loreyi]|uniref:Uncharacterized protein n=1 Tax=Mythimna loreyi TaxID=667449 RepID=A0ACC2QRE4_9NEOP|nr:hypothetical protein PYW08_003472 [Mythimna loreyi]
MNTTATFSSDHSWSRRCSTETVFSIQGKETDIARDTSDTEAADSDATDASDVEYEPVTEPDDDGPLDDDDTSANSDNDIIATRVVEVSVGDDGELQFADSERTDSHSSDSELDLHDYWNCAQCRAQNNNPLYRYCFKCFQVRKNFFPPRPKRKRNILTKTDEIEIPRTMSQDSGVDSPMSQETDVLASQDVFAASQDMFPASQDLSTQELQPPSQEIDPILESSGRKMNGIRRIQTGVQPASKITDFLQFYSGREARSQEQKYSEKEKRLRFSCRLKTFRP